MKDFLNFSVLSVKEHFDIIKGSSLSNPPFNSIHKKTYRNAIIYELMDYDICFYKHDDDSTEFSIQDHSFNLPCYSLVESRNYSSYCSHDYSYRKDLCTNELSYKQFTLNGIDYAKNTFNASVRYHSISDKIKYNRILTDYNYCIRSLYSDINNISATAIESEFFNRNFQILEKSKISTGFVFESNFDISIPKENNNKLLTSVHVNLKKETKDSNTLFEMKWNYDDRLVFELDTPDASIMHLYNTLYTFQSELLFGKTDYYHFKNSLIYLEKILEYYKSELPIISIVLENIKRNKDGN